MPAVGGIWCKQCQETEPYSHGVRVVKKYINFTVFFFFYKSAYKMFFLIYLASLSMFLSLCFSLRHCAWSKQIKLGHGAPVSLVEAQDLFLEALLVGDILLILQVLHVQLLHQVSKLSCRFTNHRHQAQI